MVGEKVGSELVGSVDGKVMGSKVVGGDGRCGGWIRSGRRAVEV